MYRHTHFLALPTERAGSSNALLTMSTVSARSWFLNALLGLKKKKKKSQEDKHFVNPCVSPAFKLWVYLWDIYLFVYSPPPKKIIMQLINVIAWGMPIRKKKNAGSWIWHIMALNSPQKARNLSSKMSILLSLEMLGAGGGTVAGADTLFFIFSILYWSIVDLRCSISFWCIKQSGSVINLYILS